MAKVQYNPSTLKVAYSPGTKKVQMVRWYIPGTACNKCGVDGTPEFIYITFHGLVDCDNCNNSYRLGTWYKSIGAAAALNNRTFCLAYSSFCRYYQVGGGWPVLPVGPIKVDYYSNSTCTNFNYTVDFLYYRFVFNLASIVGNTYTMNLTIDVAANPGGGWTEPVFYAQAAVIIDDSGVCIPDGNLNNILPCGVYVQPSVGNTDPLCTGGYVELEGGGVKA